MASSRSYRVASSGHATAIVWPNENCAESPTENAIAPVVTASWVHSHTAAPATEKIISPLSRFRVQVSRVTTSQKAL